MKLNIFLLPTANSAAVEKEKEEPDVGRRRPTFAEMRKNGSLSLRHTQTHTLIGELAKPKVTSSICTAMRYVAT